MIKSRGKTHTTLTETALVICKEISKIQGVKMIAPGKITNTRKTTSGRRWLTAVYTNAGMELIVTGQGTQKISVHTSKCAPVIFNELIQQKNLKSFNFKERKRKPGI